MPQQFKNLYCYICGHRSGPIGRFDPAVVRHPLKGDMFDPLGARFPAPFHPKAGFWEMMCRRGGHRAIPDPKSILSDPDDKGGFFSVPDEIPAPVMEGPTTTVECELCGAKFKSLAGLTSHTRNKHK